MHYSIIEMKGVHRDPVMKIYNHYIEHSMAAYRQDTLPLEAYDQILKRIENYPAFVAQGQDGEMAGFAFLSGHKDIAEFSHTAQFTSFLHPDRLRSGLGSHLLTCLEREAKRYEITNILAHISSLNEPSIAFHKRHGFIQCGCFRGVGYKNGRFFDTVWMQKILNPE